MSYNEISDIRILEKVNFKELNNLDLSNNEIIDIHILEKVNFKKLKKLDLCGNKINEEEKYSKSINLKSKINHLII